MYYIYILYSHHADKYYLGYTSDLDLRIQQHNSTGDKITFTRKYQPWVLKAAFECGPDRSTALRIERFLKKQKSRSLLEKMINGDALTGILAALKRVNPAEKG
jgi:putative endonuclease